MLSFKNMFLPLKYADIENNGATCLKTKRPFF